MNELSNTQNSGPVLLTDEQAKKAFTLANLIFNPQAMEMLHKTATNLSNSGLVPDHLRGKPDDVMAIMMQAGRWGMDVIAVAQCSFVLNGKIGYEAKLQQAVAKALGGIDFEYEYYGNWSKIQGNFTIKTNQNQKKYNAPNWNQSDEIGVGMKLTGIFPDGRRKSLDVALVTCHPRNSTNWANDPQTQIYYTGVKRFIRINAPHLNMGIQDYDDLAAAQSGATEREINPMPADSKDKSGKVETVEDILSTSNDAPAPQQTETVASVDDILNQGDTVPPANHGAPSVYEQMCDLLAEVNTAEDYLQVKKSCIEAFENGLIQKNESEDLGKTMRTLEKALNIGKK